MRLIDDFYAYLWPGATMAEMQIYGNNCNSYIVANALAGNKHVIVDPGAVVNEARQNCLNRLASEMEEDGIMMQDIGLTIITHAHWDRNRLAPADYCGHQRATQRFQSGG